MRQWLIAMLVVSVGNGSSDLIIGGDEGEYIPKWAMALQTEFARTSHGMWDLISQQTLTRILLPLFTTAGGLADAGSKCSRAGDSRVSQVLLAMLRAGLVSLASQNLDH